MSEGINGLCLWAGGVPWYSDERCLRCKLPWRRVPILRVTAKRVFVPLFWDLPRERWTWDGNLLQVGLNRTELNHEGCTYHRKAQETFFTDEGVAYVDASWAEEVSTLEQRLRAAIGDEEVA